MQRNANDTVDGIAGALGLAPATIRRHLDILQRDSLVAFDEVRKKTGRPEYSFYLTEQGHESLPKDYDLLLSMLVQELADLGAEDTTGRDGGRILDMAFERMSERVWREYEERVAGRGFGHRMETLMTALEHRDFSPEAEVVDGSLRIRLLNCPFRSVALQNMAVCSFDRNLISSMLDVDVAREACIQDGDACCTYVAAVGSGEAEQFAAIGQS